MAEKHLAKLVCLANLKDRGDNCGATGNEVVCVLLFLICNDAIEMYEAYNASEMCDDTHQYHGNCSLVINALNQLFVTKNVLQNTHQEVDRATKPPERNKP